MNNQNFTLATPADSIGVDDYLVSVMRQEQFSRKLWLYLSVTIIASVSVFIATL